FLVTRRPPPTPPLFPYTTLFRSRRFPRFAVIEPDRHARCLEVVTECAERRQAVEEHSLQPTDLARFPGDGAVEAQPEVAAKELLDRKSTRLNSSHVAISYAVFCL